MSGFKKPEISILFYIIVVLFNLSSWIDLEGAWAELPLLVPQLPEGWALPSQVTIASQIAAIGPFFYFVANSIKPGLIKEYVAVYIVVVVGFTGCVLLIFFWDATAVIAGEERSVGLLTLTFFLAFTDNTSTIVFLSYFAILPAEYLSAYYIGEALCGFIPSIASLIQGAGEYDCVNTSSVALQNYTWSDGNDTRIDTINVTEWKLDAVMRTPLFSESVFFSLLATVMVISGTAFTLINFHPWCKKFHVKAPNSTKTGEQSIDYSTQNDEVHVSNVSVKTEKGSAMDKSSDNLVSSESPDKPKMSTRLYVCLLLQYGYLQSMRYGLLYNVQSYSLLPYGAMAYSLGVRLTTVVQTLSCVVALFFPTRSVKVITACTLLGSIPAVYIMLISLMSPEPYLVDSDWGVVIILASWLIMSSLWGYCKVGIAVLMKDQGKRHLMTTGIVEVMCILILSIVIFVLINFFTFFKEAPECPV